MLSRLWEFFSLLLGKDEARIAGYLAEQRKAGDVRVVGLGSDCGATLQGRELGNERISAQSGGSSAFVSL